MEYIKKYGDFIIVGLLIIILLQCCGGCSKRQQIRFQEQRIEQVADSLKEIETELLDSISVLNQDLAVSVESNRQLNDANKSLKDANSRPIIIKNEQK